MRRFTLLTVLTLSALVALNGCGRKNNQKDNLISSHTTGANETMAATTPADDASKPDSSADEEASATGKETGSGKTAAGSSQGETVKNVSASIHTFKEGKVSIEYPVISNLKDSSVQEKVNKLLLEHAKEFLSAYSVDTAKDTLTVQCKVMSADRKRATAVYTGTYSPEGAAHPTAVFYTNTVDTVFGRELGLTDYADPYTLAGYVLSDDCKFCSADPDIEKELMAVKNGTDIETYTNLFRNADFPYKKGSDSSEAVPFPEVFSYEEQGTIYVAIPVIHALGDYAVIEYTPDTK